MSIASFKGQAISDASFDLSAAPYPLVVLSPGFSIGSTAYAWLAEHLASYGFVVISPEHNEHLNPENELWRMAIQRPKDILTVFDYMDTQVDSGGLFEGLVNPETVAVIGHSYGGYTALAASGAKINPRLKHTVEKPSQKSIQLHGYVKCCFLISSIWQKAPDSTQYQRVYGPCRQSLE